MDTAYAKLDLPFSNALSVLSTVISLNQEGWYVVGGGLKALGTDHGNPSIEGADVWYCSDEHIVFSQEEDHPALSLGKLIRATPAHVDPTVAYHAQMHIISDDAVLEPWPIDLRGW